MKPAILTVATFCLMTSAAVAQSAPNPQGGDLRPWPWADQDKIPLVMTIESVTANIHKSNPNQLIVNVKAKVNSGGWSNAQIRRVYYPAARALWPTDGFADFYVEAAPPSGMAIMKISEISVPEATFEMGPAQVLNGVMVHGSTNCLWVSFNSEKPENPGRCTEYVEK